MNLDAGLATIVSALDAVPQLETVSLDPSQVTAPGAVVQLVELEQLTLATWLVTTQVVLVVTDSDGGPGPAAAFSTILSALHDAGIDPDGPVTARSVQLPTNPAPLPGLLFPLTVRIPA